MSAGCTNLRHAMFCVPNNAERMQPRGNGLVFNVHAAIRDVIVVFEKLGRREKDKPTSPDNAVTHTRYGDTRALQYYDKR